MQFERAEDRLALGPQSSVGLECLASDACKRGAGVALEAGKVARRNIRTPPGTERPGGTAASILACGNGLARVGFGGQVPAVEPLSSDSIPYELARHVVLRGPAGSRVAGGISELDPGEPREASPRAG